MCLFIFYIMFWFNRVECFEVTWSRFDFVKMGDFIFCVFDFEKYLFFIMGYVVGCVGGIMMGVFFVVNE